MPKIKEMEMEIERRKRMNAVVKVLQEEHIQLSSLRWMVPLSSGHFENGLVTYGETGETFIFFDSSASCRVSEIGNSDNMRTVSGTWEDRIALFRQWIRDVSEYEKRVLHEYEETPDLWETLTSVSEQSLSSGAENVPFTPAEQEYIEKELRQIRGAILESHRLTEAQIQDLGERVEYMIETSKRMGRKDWVMLVWGLVTSAFVGGIFAPEVTSYFVSSVERLVQPFIERAAGLL